MNINAKVSKSDMKKITFLLVLLSLTGCNNVKQALFPGDPGKPGVQDPGSICRATPSLILLQTYNPNRFDYISDNIHLETWEQNGVDGVTETVTLCKSTCVSISQTGILSDGTVISFNGFYVDIQLAKTNGYTSGFIRQDFTCHGN